MNRIVLGSAVGVFALAMGTSMAGENSKSEAALHGYCPVAYVAMHKAVKGDPKVSLEHEGERYQFANGDAKKMFEADPAKYQVAYDGWCTTAISMGKKVESDPTIFTVTNGRTYLFSTLEAKKMFDRDQAAVIDRADAQWSILNPALGGYCPVAYAAMHKAVKGDPRISVDYRGKHYVFANADAKRMFEAAPTSYRVAYEGWCATAMAMGKKVPSDPDFFTVREGVTYLFSSLEAKKMFDGGAIGFIEKADAKWLTLR